MYSIGEFARLGAVSVRTLRHYDELGLLRPARVDPETGYRSYEAAQLARLNRIVALKELGFALAEVGTLLGDITDEELRGILLLRRAQLARQLDEDRVHLLAVDARLRAIEREDEMPDDVIIKSLPAQRVAAVGRPAPGFGPRNLTPVLDPAFRDLDVALEASGVRPVGPAFAFYTGDPDANDLMAYAAHEVAADVSEIADPAGVLELAAVPAAATVVRHGRVADIYANLYADLARWIDANGFEHVGAGRDVFVKGSEDPDVEHVIEIQWPIRRPGDRRPDVLPHPVETGATLSASGSARTRP
jgi:DNA-binding transcriptional MerR regulator